MGLFENGVSGNPAEKPKGLVSERARALNALDQVAAKDDRNACRVNGAGSAVWGGRGSSNE